MSVAPAAPAPPRRRSAYRRLLDISFRAKLLIALVGTVGLLGLASLAVVRVQTDRQVAWMITRTTERAQRALVELERFRRADLDRVAKRITGSIRIVAALDAALDDGDIEAFVEHVEYELSLAEVEGGLVAFNDTRGRPVVTLVDGARVADGHPQDHLLAQVMAKGVVTGGYRIFERNRRLFAVLGHRLELFGEPVGMLTVGFPLDTDVASRLGEIVGADVCFAAEGHCVVGTPGTQDEMLRARMIEAAHAGEPIFATFGGRRMALVSSPLSATSPVTGIVAVPLEDVLTPFDRIRFVEGAAASVALVLAVVFGVLLSKGLTTPIRALMSATRRVRQGELDFVVEVPNRDELGSLADAFNQMTQGLLLKERYRSVLDKVVSPRVAEELMKGDIRLGGETRAVTTLFADIRGFTGWTKKMAPEEAIGMLNEWLELTAGSIEEQGGVVDKYVGDQVMAILGAPIAQDDHAIRAVRAGLRLRELTGRLSRERQAHARESFSIGIGINTGVAVAGNMGSSNRLNYTVIGASVNAAARLCSEAAAGELLIGEETYHAVADLVDASRLPPRISKGFSDPITPYAVRGYRGERSGDAVARRVSAMVLSAVVTLSSPAIAQAQIFGLPTLSELGVRFVSPGGLVQIQPSLRIELDGFFPQDAPAWHLDETNAFVAGSGRLFLDLFVGRQLYAMAELRVDRGQPARAGSLQGRLQQAFVRVTPVRGRNAHVQAGKFVSPFGTYPQRAHTVSDPFIRPPLLYDHRTVMSADFVPTPADAVFGWKDKPQFRSAGLPIVWDVPYPIGAMAVAGGRGWTVVAGVMNTALSAEPSDWDRSSLGGAAGPSFVGRVSYQFTPEFRLGASYSQGSYMRPDVEDASGPLTVDRQHQRTRGVDATYARGHLEMNAEIVFNTWDLFRAADTPADVSYYIEARRTLTAGVFVAARYSAIHFRPLQRAEGGEDRWDYDRRRWQVGAGYRLGRSAEIRAEYMVNRTLGTVDPRNNLLSLRWWLTF